MSEDHFAHSVAGRSNRRTPRAGGCTPAGCLLSLPGLVRHLTDDELGWFRRTLAGEDVGDLYETEADPDAAFNGADGADPDSSLAAWQAECERSRAVVASRSLDDVGRQSTGRVVSLRWILVHMIEEYSRHNGHADLLRESIDGATGYD